MIWDVDYIREVVATIKFPERIENKIDNYEYCGLRGEENNCGSFSVSGNIVEYGTDNNLY